MPVANRAGVDARLASNYDISKFDRFRKFRGGKAVERLRAGDLCFIAEKNGKIPNYTWICFHEAYVPELEAKIRIDPNSAYRYDAYTDPEYRGRGILPIVLTRASDYLFQNGIERIYDLVSFDNYPSLRSHQKIGSRKMGEVTFFKLFRSKRYRYKGETPEDSHKLEQMFSA
jgi:GNAT superfamily N-acetyltransferase